MKNIIKGKVCALNWKWCEKLKKKIPKPPYPAHRKGDMQFFAYFQPLGEGVTGEDIVIAIGSNYSQGDDKMQEECADEKTPCLTNLPFVLEQIRKNEGAWRELGWLGGELPAESKLPRHFIMTNLVPWITSKKDTNGREISWGNLLHDECEKLRALYFDNFHDEHLSELERAFPQAFVIWHGINENIYPHIEKSMKRTKWKNWAFYANLTRRFRPEWDAGIPKNQRPKFKIGRRK